MSPNSTPSRRRAAGASLPAPAARPPTAPRAARITGAARSAGTGRPANIWRRSRAGSIWPTCCASARAIEGETGMLKALSIAVVAAATLIVAGCASVPPRNTGTSYDCDRGTRPKVDYVGDGAIVRVHGRQTVVLQSTPAQRGQEIGKGAWRERGCQAV